MNLAFYTQPFPTFSLNHDFILREQTLEDTEAFFNYYTEPDVGKYILATKPRTLLEASQEVQFCRNLFYTKKGIYWTIARKSDNIMIGAIGLYLNAQHRRAELTYDLAKPYWRRGIMTKAIQIVLKFAFSTMELVRIEAITRIENEASIAILKKVGFVYEGSLKKYRFHEGQMWDIEIFAITSDSFNQTK